MKKTLLNVLPIALWYTFHLVLMLIVFVYAFPQVKEGLPVTYPSVTHSFNKILTHYGLSDSMGPASFVVTFFTVLIFMCGIVRWLFQKILDRFSGADVYRLSFEAVLWSVRNFFKSGMILVPLLAGILFLFQDNGSGYIIFVGVVAVSAIISLPVMILDARRLGSDRFDGWYRMQWPGFQPLIMFWSGTIGLKAIELAITTFISHWTGLIAYLVWCIFEGWVGGVLLSLFLERKAFAWMAREIRIRGNARFITAWFLLDLRIAILALWCVPPILFAVFTKNIVIPTYVYTFSMTGQKIGFIEFIIFTLNVLTEHLVFAAIFSGIVLIFMVRGRFLVLYDRLIPKLSCSGTTGLESSSR